MNGVTIIQVLAALLLTAVLLPLYFLPAVIGIKRRNKIAILVLNLLLGWTVIGWIAVLIWAVREDEPESAHPLVSVRAVLPQYCAGCRSYSTPNSSVCRNCGRALHGLRMGNS